MLTAWPGSTGEPPSRPGPAAAPPGGAAPRRAGGTLDPQARAHLLARLDELYQQHRDGHDDAVVSHYEPGVGYRPGSPERAPFAICLATVDGDVVEVGDRDHRFPLQSLSKVVTYGMALEAHGRAGVLERVGVEPSGDAFNALVLDRRNRRPHNPMVNAGALVTAELVADGDTTEAAMKRVLETVWRYTGDDTLQVDAGALDAELRTADRNRATAYLMRSHGMLAGDVEATLGLYLSACSVGVTCRDLALMGATLAGGGTNPLTGARALPTRCIRDVLSVMYTCGMYDVAGQWAYEVGIPAKSGVSGGIVAVVPGKLGIGVFSPGLDAHGNSVRGAAVCAEISERLGLHAFAGDDEDVLLPSS